MTPADTPSDPGDQTPSETLETEPQGARPQAAQPQTAAPQPAGDRTPGTEVCNGTDDDCDTRTDEGNPGGGTACGSAEGECAPEAGARGASGSPGPRTRCSRART